MLTKHNNNNNLKKNDKFKIKSLEKFRVKKFIAYYNIATFENFFTIEILCR